MTPLAPDPTLVATLLAKRRADVGIPLREVARRTHSKLSEGTVRRILGARTDIKRPPETVAEIAAVLGVGPAELAGAGREDAAGALRQLLRETAGQPDVSAALGGPVDEQSVGEVLQGLRMISAMDVPERVKDDLRAVLLEYLAHGGGGASAGFDALRHASQQ